MVYILHISDLHFYHDASMNNFRKNLLDEAKEKVHDKPRGEKLLVVTGDFHNYWSPDYRDALEFLHDLIDAMDIDPTEDVFFVPGNHDVGNDTLLAKHLKRVDPDWKKHDKSAANMIRIGNMEYVEERLHAFRPYSCFARELKVYTEDQGIDYPAQVHIRCWRGKLNILHLNTALVADDKTKNNQAADTTTATDHTLWAKWYRDEIPALALGHNSFYDLEEHQQLQLGAVFQKRNISAYLCGDTHLVELTPAKQTIPMNAGEMPIPNIVCAKSVADTKDSYSDFGYFWHEWDEKTDNVEAYFIRWREVFRAQTAQDGIPKKYKMRRKTKTEKSIPSTDDGKPVIKRTNAHNTNDELRSYLAEVLKQKRDSHPSFQLLKADEIDSRLFPRVEEYKEIPPLATFPAKDGSRREEHCPVWDIIRESWVATEHRSVVIIGEGGIGKTVTLFSITRPSEKALVPAIYIPMCGLVEKNGNILELTDYIKNKYKKYGDAIEALATSPWIERPQLLILLDGFNEIPHAFRRPILTEINEWHDTHPGIQLIAVSRPMDGLNLSQELAGNPIALTLAQLDDTTVRTYLKEAGRKVPPINATIWNDLKYPLFLNLYIKTGRLNGKTVAGYPLRVKDSDSGGALIWNYLQRELLRHSKDKAEKAEDWVLRCSIANEFILPYVAYHMVLQQRMDVTFDQVITWTGEALQTLYTSPLPKHLKVVWAKYRRLHHGKYPNKELFTDDEWKDTVLQDTGILVSTTRIHYEKNDGEDNAHYVFMHQNFRDCLAGLYLVNQAEMVEDNSFPEIWGHSQNHLVLNYAAELIDASVFDDLWQAHRIVHAHKTATSATSHIATCNLLEICMRYKKLHKELDFSGMNLCGLSLTRYLGKGGFGLPLFQTSELLQGTTLDRSVFESVGHDGSISTLAVLSDGRVLSAASDHTIRVWDVATGQCLTTLVGHSDWVRCIVAFPDGRIVSGSDDNTLRVWDTSTGQCLHILKGHNNWVSCVAILPDGCVVSGSHDNTLRVWDAISGNCLYVLKGHRNWVSCVGVLPSGHVVSGSYDNTLRVWDAKSGLFLRVLEGHSNTVNCLSIFPDGRVVSGSSDSTLLVWNAVAGQRLQTLKGHKFSVNCVDVLSDMRVVSGSDDASLRVWDAATGQCLHILDGHKFPISCVAVLPDCRVISGSDDTTLYVWDATTGQFLQTLEGHCGRISCVAGLPDGRVVSGSLDNTLRIWDAATSRCLQTLEGHKGSVWCVTVYQDGNLVSGLSDNTLRIWNVTSGKCKQTLEGHKRSVFCVDVLSNEHVVSGSDDTTLRVWNTHTGQCVQILEGHSGSVCCVSVLPNGHVVSGSQDNTLRVWDTATGQCLQNMKGHNNSVNCVAVLPDGNVVSGSSDSLLQVWNVTTGQCLKTLEGHTWSVICVAVLPDGRIVSGSDDTTLRVWDIATGECLQVLSGHNYGVSCVAVLPNGRVVSGSDDNTLRVWDVNTGKCLHTLEGHTAPVNCVTALLDGRVVSGSHDSTLRVWDPETGVCLDKLEAMEVNVSKMDFVNATLSDDLAELLWHNGARISDIDYELRVKPNIT